MRDYLYSIEGLTNLPRYFSRIFPVLQNLKHGRLDIGLPSGDVIRIDSDDLDGGPHARFDVIDDGLFARIVRDGEIGFAEAYMDGDWTTPNLQALLDLFLQSNEEIGRSLPAQRIAQYYERIRHWLRSNSKGQARRNISAHYDLGNAFYSTWLDETMTYSSALYDTPADQGNEALSDAQHRKYDSICNMIGAKDGANLLEIGCGWGGFAEHAAKYRGARVTGLTISKEQHDFAKQRVFEAGLADRVDIVMRDYRDERGSYDGIASIEMFEAVGEKYWSQYFSCLHDRLNPGAIAGLQVITVQDGLFDRYRKGVDFIQKYIFPGGMLPSVKALEQEVEAAGLAVTDKLLFGPSYSRTLRRWRGDFHDAWDRIEPMGFDARFRRMWDFYLASCAATFRAGTTDVVQIGIRHG